MRSTGERAMLVLLAVLLAAAFVVLFHVGDPRAPAHDVRLYQRYTYGWALSGTMPYRDYVIEYPPAALAAFALPHLLALGRAVTLGVYERLFAVAGLVCAFLTGLIVMRSARIVRPAAPAWIPIVAFAAGAVAVSKLVALRYDIFPAMLTALSLYLLLRERYTSSGAALGLAVAMKLYPVVLAPVWVLYLLARGDRRALSRGVVGGVAGAVVPVLPFLLLAPHGLARFLGYHADRGLQLESVAASPFMLAHLAGAATVTVQRAFGAHDVVAPGSAFVSRVLAAVFVAGYALAMIACWRRFRAEREADGAVSPGTLVGWALLALLLFVATNKVFSAQYAIWLLPFAPLLSRRHAVWLVAICTLTGLVYMRYRSLIVLGPRSIAAVSVRNALLVGWLAVTAAQYALVRRAGPASSRPD